VLDCGTCVGVVATCCLVGRSEKVLFGCRFGVSGVGLGYMGGGGQLEATEAYRGLGTGWVGR
jgi:hypothetical protein